MGKLDGRTALVTGGCSGIGLAIAGLFATEGARVGILDLDAGRARATAERLGREHGARTAGEAADVADEAAVKAGIAAIVRELGEVDILVNNAGMDTTSRVEDMPTEMFDRMIAVHLRGTFLCTREVLPAMRRRGWGRIINYAKCDRCRGEVRAGRSGPPGAPGRPRAGCDSRGSAAGCR